MPPLKQNTTDEETLDWFGAPNGNVPLEPAEVSSVSPPAAEKRPEGWKIRDYYLDDKNASNWEQLRSAWTHKNGSEFVFNNKISYNPNYDPKKQPLPEVHFLNGATMPTLPTMEAPTNIPMNQFPKDDDEDDQDEELALPIKPTRRTTEAAQPYGMRYPWQWHNRRPTVNKYQDAKLNFHGRPTRVPTSRPFVATNRPTTPTQPRIATPTPTNVQMNPEYVKAMKNKEDFNSTANNSSNEEQSQDKTSRKPDQTDGKSDKEDGKDGKLDKQGDTDSDSKKQGDKDGGLSKHVDNEGKSDHPSDKDGNKIEVKNDEGNQRTDDGKWEKNATSDNVLAESLNVSLSNTAQKIADEPNADQDQSLSKEAEPIFNPSTPTKAPVELPILSEPTTKSAENYLPGVRPPTNANERQDLLGTKLDTLQWFQANEESNTTNGTEHGDQTSGLSSNQALNSPYSAVAYEAKQLSIAEDAQQRAKVTDSPLSQQAESVNQIRRFALKTQNPAQRQQVAKNDSSTGAISPADQYGMYCNSK